jgi:hypothetical protein
VRENFQLSKNDSAEPEKQFNLSIPTPLNVEVKEKILILKKKKNS